MNEIHGEPHTILWRRLDTPGTDACRLEQGEDGWQLEGRATFCEGAKPAQLTYRVACDPAWFTLWGDVRGWIGRAAVQLAISRASGGSWMVNGAAMPALVDCLDLDLGFTPATNLVAIRRLALADGQSAEAPAAWLNLPAKGLEVLPQRYERRGAATYWYEAPTVDYAGLLDVTATGFVRYYPGLWEAKCLQST